VKSTKVLNENKEINYYTQQGSVEEADYDANHIKPIVAKTMVV